MLCFIGTVRCLMTGCTYALPLCQTFPPRPDELVRNLEVNDGITDLVAVPSLLEQLVEELLSTRKPDVALKPLQKLKYVMYGGASCPEELSRKLVENGVRLASTYGSTGQSNQTSH